MTDLEINIKLAEAIGWSEEHIKRTDYCFVWRGFWREFDHRDWGTIGPIAERYNVFPYAHKIDGWKRDGKWVVWPDIMEDTPQKAIAMAVIARSKK